MTGRDRRDALWQQVLASPARVRSEQDERELIRGLALPDSKHQFLIESFAHPDDTLPPSRARVRDQRRRPGVVAPDAEPHAKLFHACGATAPVRLAIERGPYTGLLAPGASAVGLCRASTNATFAQGPDGERVPRFSPGIALKLFPDGDGPSENVLAIYRLEGPEAGTTDFFGVPLHTWLEVPKGDTIVDKARWHALLGVFQAALAWWGHAAHAPPNPLRLDLSSLSARGVDGEPVEAPRGPRSLTFRPTPAAMAHRTGAEFRDRLRDFVGPMYTVHDHDGAALGRLEVEAGFVESAFGDDALFFRHPPVVRAASSRGG